MPFSSIMVLAGLLVILAAVVFYQFFWPNLRLQRIQGRPFAPAWEQLMRRAIPVYDGLPADKQLQLQDLIKQFIADKRIVGCAGQQIDDEIRVTIAANACLLLLNKSTGCYPQLRSVLVYPSTFIATHEERDALGLVSTQKKALAGESWNNGKIVLAWDEVRRGVTNFNDGYNVVLHEFAHELDHEDGASDGAPLLRTQGAYKEWATVLSAEYDELQQSVGSDIDSVLDKYGATNPAEFFAVATETFFERPHEMQQHHGELYKQLQDYYQVDPASWADAARKKQSPQD